MVVKLISAVHTAVQCLFPRPCFFSFQIITLCCSTYFVVLSIYCCSWLSNVTFSSNSFVPAAKHEAFNGVLDDPASYVNALAFVLSASRASRASWSIQNECSTDVKAGALDGNTNAKAYNIKPAVVAAAFGAKFLAGDFALNVGFPHIVSVHSSTVITAVQMRSNVAESSVLRVMDASARVFDTTLARNQVRGGSVFQGDSFVGEFQQVRVGLAHIQRKCQHAAVGCCASCT